MKVLHAIHDFLPRHQSGSEVYALNLCHAQAARGLNVHVLCADDDLALRHGSVRHREFDGIPIVELINNWTFASFRDMYASPVLNRALREVLVSLDPDVLHIHNLLNLSFDLPAIARDLDIPTVATLHDYTLVCASGGQRMHRAEQHICTLIDPRRCSRCFAGHNFYERSTFGPDDRGAKRAGPVGRIIRLARQPAATLFDLLTRAPNGHGGRRTRITPELMEERLGYVQHVFETTDLFIAPSPHLATEYRHLGLPGDKLRVSDYGFRPLIQTPRRPSPHRLRIGFVGALVWHKGAHVLVDAARMLPSDRFELHIFGDPTEFAEYSASLRDRARGLPIRFAGRFERERVAEVYATFDVLVVPSLWPENSPLVIHEAFMSGIPVVASRQGGNRDLIEHEVNGLLYDAFSTEDLAGALRSLLDEPERLARLAAAVPAVKSMAQDAAELDLIYRDLREAVAGRLADARQHA